MNTITNKTQIGKNGTTEYTFSNENMEEKFCQLFFQLLRTDETQSIEFQFNELIQECKKRHSIHPEFLNNEDILKYTFKMIGHTRDIINGKGEYSLTYMMIYVLYSHFPGLALKAIDSLVYFNKDRTKHIHPYGSWKDLKYLSYYVFQKTKDKNHPIIEYCCKLYTYQLLVDVKYVKLNKPKMVSLASKWCPREKSKYRFLFTKIAELYNPLYLISAKKTKNTTTIHKALKKTKKECRKILSSLNSYIDTTQVKMCNHKWSSIQFNKVSSNTIYKNNKAFLNTKQSKDKDRIECSNHLKQYIYDCKNTITTHMNMYGNTLYVYEIMKQIDILVNRYEKENRNIMEHIKNYNKIQSNETMLKHIQLQSSEICRQYKDEIDILQLQWEKIKSKIRPIKKTYMIPILDTSFSMNSGENTIRNTNNTNSIFSGIGLSILLSEINNTIFKDCILTFSKHSQWINLSHAKSIVEKYIILKQYNSCIESNFYKAIELLLDVIILNELTSNEVKQIKMVILSNMQINKPFSYSNTNSNSNTMFKNIYTMFVNAGLQSKYKIPYEHPHIIFWNLASTTGFPNTSTQRNTTMISGYSPTLFNGYIGNTKLNTIQEYSPFVFIKKLLDNDRYEPLSNYFLEYLQTYIHRHK